jgi:AP-1 complex subunit gamma-1
VHKLFGLLKEDMSQLGLVTTAVWSIGELGDLLMQDQRALDEDTPGFPAQSPGVVLDLLERVARDHSARALTRCFVVTALLKLADRTRGAELARVQALLATYQTSMQLELQERSSEYGRLLEPAMAGLRPELLARVPALDEAVLKVRRARFAEEAAGSEGPLSPGRAGAEGAGSSSRGQGHGLGLGLTAAGGPGSSGHKGDLLDLDDIFGAGSAPKAPSTPTYPMHQQQQQQHQQHAAPQAPAYGGNGSADLLSDIFSSAPGPAPAPPAPSSSSLADLLSSSSGSVAVPPQPPLTPLSLSFSSGDAVQPQLLAPQAYGGPPAAPMGASSITAFEKDGLSIIMDLAKPNPADLQTSQLSCRFINSGPAPITGLVFQCAVPKYVKLEMGAASGTSVPPNGAGAVEQAIKVTNSMLGQKALQLKIKVQYSINGVQYSELGQVSGFPEGF